MAKTPDNAAAREVERLRSWNADLDEQISTLMATKLENAETNGLLLTVANWVETTPAPAEPTETTEAETTGTDTATPTPTPTAPRVKVELGAEVVRDKITQLEEAEQAALSPSVEAPTEEAAE